MRKVLKFLAVAFVLLSGGAAYSAGEVAIICDEPGAIAASRSGKSGRHYPCYSLEPVSGIVLVGAALFCDEDGTIVAARSGRSGRRHACYVLGAEIEAQVGSHTIICDDEHGAAASRSGIAGRRYDCYALEPVLDPGPP